MYRERLSSRRFVQLGALFAAGLSVSGIAAPSQPTPGFSPILQLEKPVYAIDESIRFWIGLTSEVAIPEELRPSCILHWIRPDGTTFNEDFRWPADSFSPSTGWKGGWGFRKQPPSLGRYVLSFECGGRITGDRTFVVIPDPFADLIEARWTFIKPKNTRSPRAVLHIENKTDRVLRFAKPGLIDSEVWLEVKTANPRSTEDLMVPPRALLRSDEIPSFSLEQLDWTSAARWPMVTVPSGGSAERSFALGEPFSFREGRKYELSLQSVLTLFVGEHTDSDAQLFPMRIPVSANLRLE